jgi:hypothetical protein
MGFECGSETLVTWEVARDLGVRQPGVAGRDRKPVLDLGGQSCAGKARIQET